MNCNTHAITIIFLLEVKTICDSYSTQLIINDYPDVALAIHAAGIHLGKNDISPVEARKKVGEKMIIGGTANTFEDILLLNSLGCNYIGCGPFRFTTTKSNLSPILGLAGYKDIIEKCKLYEIKIPIIAIGGIQLTDIQELMESDLYGVAVSSVLTDSQNISITTSAFMKVIAANIG